MRIGDVIDGDFPDDGAPTPLGQLSTPYTFGLARFTPAVEGSFLGIRRGEEQLKLPVEPELRPWGFRPTWRAGEATAAFFGFDPE